LISLRCRSAHEARMAAFRPFRVELQFVCQVFCCEFRREGKRQVYDFILITGFRTGFAIRQGGANGFK
jgi:hypothetical protein